MIRRGLTTAGLLTSAAESRAAGPWAARLEVKTSALDMEAATMSGGNQQKVVLAKWLATEPKLLIIDEPTRGIDIGTKAEVHRLLSDLAGQGLAILMISSELPEVLGMADRVLVVREGEITADLDRSEANPESVMRAATGAAHVDLTAVEDPGPGDRMTAETLLVEPSQASPAQRIVGGLLRSREFAVLAVLVALIVVTTFKSHAFLFSSNGWRDLLLTPSILILLAVGQTVVIITRSVDLSVGSTWA